tara:strand:+ start:52 stop:1242 length:1191 start_codon:yes stop_codon:yes gene_type:complete
MFRGGQVIDSRGTGITSGLMDGGRVGYNNGNIVLGSDLLKKANLPTDLSELNKLKFSAAMPFPYKTGAASETIKEKVEDEVEKPSDVMKDSVIDKVSDSQTLTEELGDPLGSDFDTTEIIDGKVVTKPAGPLTELQKAKFAKTFIGNEEARKNFERLQKEETDRLAKEKKDTTANVIFDENDDEIVDPNKNKEVPTELSAKEMVAENKKLFAEMLGMDKARSSDIGDMLLRFAAAPGATTQEKFQTYLGAEAQAGKGRAEKINETAAALAINDYVAGKRSKENLAQTLAAVDYKIDKTLKGSVPQPEDDWRDAVFKAAGKDDSLSSDKTLGKALAGKFGKSVASIQVKEIADINTDKVKEDLIIGFNIVTLKDGNKVIVEKGASGEIKIRDDLPVY